MSPTESDGSIVLGLQFLPFYKRLQRQLAWKFYVSLSTDRLPLSMDPAAGPDFAVALVRPLDIPVAKKRISDNAESHHDFEVMWSFGSGCQAVLRPNSTTATSKMITPSEHSYLFGDASAHI